MQKNNITFDILGVRVNVTTLSLACQTIDKWIKQKKKEYVCIAPVATIIDCQSDPQYKTIVNGSGMTTPDGMPLVWLGKMKGYSSIERTYGPDLMLHLCDKSQVRGYKHYFYGGSDKTGEKLIHRLKHKFPALNIVGRYAPPIRQVHEKEDPSIIDQINQLKPDILWIGLGAPKQDFWMAEHRNELNVPVIIGVGAAFDFIAGTKRQAPLWMQRSGTEWFFRLCCEPKRLWKRYLLGNSKFVFLLLKDGVKSFLSKVSPVT